MQSRRPPARLLLTGVRASIRVGGEQGPGGGPNAACHGVAGLGVFLCARGLSSPPLVASVLGAALLLAALARREVAMKRNRRTQRGGTARRDERKRPQPKPETREVLRPAAHPREVATRNRGPTPRTRKQLETAAKLRTAGRTWKEVARRLRVDQGTLCRQVRVYRKLWGKLYKPPARAPKRRPPAGPRDETCKVLEAAAAIVAAGYSVAEAGRRLGMKPDTLRRYRRQYRSVWDEYLKEAQAESPKPEIILEKPVPYTKQPFPRKATREKMLKAIALLAGGATEKEVAGQLKLRPWTIDHWRDRYAGLWKAEWDRAMETAVAMIRRQAGTDAVLEDPEGYIRRALTCEAWARKEGRSIFPEPEHPTLRTFYEGYYKPNRLADASPRTVRSYDGRVRLWILFTGDPPLAEITVQTLARFRDCLKGMRGKEPHRRIANNTIRSYLRDLQAILDKAGPAGPRNRDAAGIIPAPVPWIKPPRLEYRTPRIVTLEQLGMLYLATAGMDVPKLYGIKPPAWWKALLVVTYNTGLRAGTLFTMRMDDIEWKNRRLVIPPSKFKTGRGQMIHLNQVVVEHLLAIRTDRELIFEWPHANVQFYRELHRLEHLAAIPREEHFGLHDLRRTVATALWQTSPAAAQFHLGHTSIGTTQRHYVFGDDIVARALDQLPQPEAFRQKYGADAEAG